MVPVRKSASPMSPTSHLTAARRKRMRTSCLTSSTLLDAVALSLVVATASSLIARRMADQFVAIAACSGILLRLSTTWSVSLTLAFSTVVLGPVMEDAIQEARASILATTALSSSPLLMPWAASSSSSSSKASICSMTKLSAHVLISSVASGFNAPAFALSQNPSSSTSSRKPSLRRLRRSDIAWGWTSTLTSCAQPAMRVRNFMHTLLMSESSIDPSSEPFSILSLRVSKGLLRAIRAALRTSAELSESIQPKYFRYLSWRKRDGRSTIEVDRFSMHRVRMYSLESR
mmetsp:Transcript_23746/g.49483  ORF Transcript_23746/g.49483 Transcript_23746/m.49483 type:complete len:288 (-) Transcript_23746:994-1857(-)